MDFFTIAVREIEKGPRKGEFEIYPDFKVGRSKDLMVRAKSFYAIWDEEAGLWSTDEYDVQRLVDQALDDFARSARRANPGAIYHVKHLVMFSNGLWAQFRKFMQNVSDNSHQLDENLTFANTEVKKTDYVSRRLPYSLNPGDYSAWDELIGTLYNTEERAKIEWTIGAIASGDAKKIQKFVVLYGPAGTGKSTLLDIVMKLFEGYTTTFDAKALGSNNGTFATEVFKGNPLVAIQHDGDLSKIEDNTKLNSIISHEEMPMNEKFKPGYTARVNAFLLMGTNQPVKISDAKSGIIRRLIDVTPTGTIIPANHYETLMAKIDFELGAIAHHCLEVYRKMGKNYYRGYRPVEMMFQTDVFFNFIEANYDIFKQENGTTLKQAYALYKEYCGETGIDRVLPQYKVREELRNYFDEFKEREMVDGETIRSVYSGFNANRFKEIGTDDTPFSLVLDEDVSIFDELAADWPAQVQVWDKELEAYRPARRWENATTTLKDLDTHEIHYVKVPENHIVIDFDLTDNNGEKSLERNLQAASVWPPTYAELSKSGNGVHLHYNYEGDVSELTAVYSDGIEVKTLLGNSALRRRLSKCNNVPVATYPGELPKKEKKKVLTEKTIKSERGLRDLIARAKNKEFNPGTKTACDFIKKILDDAYESGLEYDVTDLKGGLIAFANNATNQPMQALKIVTQMKFKSENTEGDTQTGPDLFGEDAAEIPRARDERLVFYDVEVYPNLFVICWKYEDDPAVVRMINPSPKEVEALLGYKLVGFYNRRYDNHILWAALQGYPIDQLFKRSQKIIEDRNSSAMFGSAYGLSYADIYDFSIVKQSLKKFQIDLGLKHQEMDLPWDQPVPEDRINDVVEYCVNDVISTEQVFKARKGDFVARQILAAISGLTVNDTTAKHTARIIFGDDKQPQSKFIYTDLSKEFPGYNFDLKRKPNKSEYRGEDPSEGGYVYAEPGMYSNVAVLDVASMHPTSIEQLNLFGPYTKNFSALKEARIAIKHKNFDVARNLLDGRLKPFLEDESGAKELSDALKIVINSVYGLTSASFDNPFRDIRNKDNIVAKRGALFMIDLKNFMHEQGVTVVHIKTDSIKIPNATPEIIEAVINFGAKYGYTFEHEATYDKFCLVNDAVYIARIDDPDFDGTKYEAVGAQFQHPYVYKELFTHEEIEWDDLCETKQVQKGTIYIDYEHDRPMALAEGMVFVGRTGRFVPVTEQSGGGTLYRVLDGKSYAVAGTKGHFWLEADTAKAMGDKVEIDMTYFDNLTKNAADTIWKFGNFDEFVK